MRTLRSAAARTLVLGLLALPLGAQESREAALPESRRTRALGIALVDGWRWRTVEADPDLEPFTAVWPAADRGFLAASARGLVAFDGLRFRQEPGWSELTGTLAPRDLGFDRDSLVVLTRAGILRVGAGGRIRTVAAREPPARVARLLRLEDGTLAVPSDDGISVVSTGSLVRHLDGPRPAETILSAAATMDGTLWCSTRSGLWRRHRDSWLPAVAGRPGGSPESWSAMLLPGDGLIAVLERPGTGPDCVHVRGSEARWFTGLRLGDTYTGATMMPDGIPALATLRGDVLVLDGDGVTRRVPAPAHRELVNGIAALSNRRLALTLASGQIAIGDLGSTRWVWHRPDAGFRGLSVNAIAPARRGGYWVATENGCARFDGQRYTDVITEAAGIRLTELTAVLEDGDGSLWLGSGSSFTGAVRITGGQATLHQEPEGIGDRHVHAIRRDPVEGLCFLLLGRFDPAFDDGGIATFARGAWSRQGRESGLPHDRCYDLVAGDPVMVATHAGLARRAGTGWERFSPCHLRVFTAAPLGGGRWITGGGPRIRGLHIHTAGRCEPPDDPILRESGGAGMHRTRDGRLWIASDNGLIVHDGRHAHRVTGEPGLWTTGFWPIVEAGDGSLLLGSSGRGLFSFRQDDGAPPVTVSATVHQAGAGDRFILALRGRDPWFTTPAEHLRFEIQVDGGPFSPPIAGNERELSVTGGGVHEIAVRAVDMFGNREERPFVVHVERPRGFWQRTETLVLAGGLLLTLGLLSLIAARRRADHRRSEERERVALETSERLYREMVERIDAVLVQYGPDGSIRYVSPGVTRISGWSPSELKASTDFRRRIVHPDDAPVMTRFIDARARGDTSPLEDVFRIIHRDGSLRTLLFRQTGRVDSAGRVICWDGIVLDITERQRLEASLAESEERFRRAQKIESLGALAGGIAHDFNNLLLAILLSTDLAQRTAGGATVLEEHLDRIRAAGQRGSELCRQLLAYAGASRTDRRSADLNAILRDVTPLARLSALDPAVLALDTGPDLPPVFADPSQISQVALNLIINAVESLPGGQGQVTIRTRAASLSADDIRSLHGGDSMSPGTFVVLEVEDTGGGMDVTTLSRIFEPFFTTKFAGRGLGLSAVLGIVRSHGGGISVRSRPGSGTTFTVYLPAANVPPAPEPAATVGAEPTHAGGTILLVDDDELVREVTEAALRTAGFTVLAVPDGRTALDVFADRMHEITAAVIDVLMPGLPGPAVMDRLRAMAPHLPVVLVSGHAQDALRDRLEDGRTVFLTKPFAASSLIRILAGFPR